MHNPLWAVVISLSLLIPSQFFTIAYAANYGKSALISTIHLGKEGSENGWPSSVVVNPDTNTVYIANRNSDTIVVVDAVSNNVTGIISVGHGPLDIALSPDANTLYAVNGYPYTISVIDIRTNSVVSTIDFSKELASINVLSGVAINTETNKAYVLINGGNEAFVAVFDILTNEVGEIFKIAELVPDYDVGRGARDIAVNSSTNTIYVTMDFDSVLVIDGSDNRVVKTIPVKGPTTIAINEKTNTIYSGNFFSQSVSIIDGSSNMVTDTLNAIEPQRIEVDGQTDTIYVSGYGGLTIIDGKSHQARNWITTGEFSEGVALNPDTGLLYIANARANTVSVVQTVPEPEWKTAYARGRFLHTQPQLPDQIFKIKYRIIDGTVEAFATQDSGAVARVNSSSNGLFEIIYPRSYPYTNTISGTYGVKPSVKVNDSTIIAKSYENNCFFEFSIPFTGESKIELKWTYLSSQEPYHGDSVPEECLPDAIADGSMLTPRQQLKAGISAQDIACPAGLVLVVSPSGKPYCATPVSADVLNERWHDR